MTEKEINEQFTAKIEKGIFKPVARHLTNMASAEDRLQDSICQVWMMFRRYAKRGKVLPDAILVFSCRQRAVDLARHFVPADGTWRNQDVMDPRCFRDGKAELLRLDGVCDDQNAEGDRTLEIGLADELCQSTERKMNSAMDLEQWVGGLAFRDQALMAGKMAGFETTRLAHDLSLPYGVTYQREKQLGHELARRAGVSIAPREKRGPRHQHQPAAAA
jgi:hypothetical protein